MRPRSVVITRVLGEHTPQMPLAQNEQVIQTLLADRANPALRHRVRLRRLERREHDVDTLGYEDVVKCRRELGVVVVNQEPPLRRLVREVPNQLACLLAHPDTVWPWGTTCQMYPTRAQLDGEEIAGEHLGSIVVQKRPPGTATALGSRWQMMPSHDIPHGTAIDFTVQLQQLALDFVITHPGVLACQTENESFQVRLKPGTSTSGGRGRDAISARCLV